MLKLSMLSVQCNFANSWWLHDGLDSVRNSHASTTRTTDTMSIWMIGFRHTACVKWLLWRETTSDTSFFYLEIEPYFPWMTSIQFLSISADLALLWYTWYSHHESDGSLLVNIDRDVGALDPSIGAQMSQSYIWVSARKKAVLFLVNATTFLCSAKNFTHYFVLFSKGLLANLCLYLGTNESVFCSVVGSSSNREAISFPWVTATNLYLMLSPWDRLLLRLLSIYRSGQVGNDNMDFTW